MSEQTVECVHDVGKLAYVVEGGKIVAHGENCEEALKQYEFENAFSAYPPVSDAGPQCNLENPEHCESCQ